MTTQNNVTVLGTVDHRAVGLIVTFSDGSSYTVTHAETDKYSKAKALLAAKDDAGLVNLLNPRAKVHSLLGKSANGRIKLEGGRVTDETGMDLAPFLVEHLMWMAETDTDVQPLLNFMERLQANPSYQARTEIGEWAIKARMPITPDGFILAYKKVNKDYTSIHDGKFKNDVGTTVEMPGGRGNVDDNRNNHCSRGLHFCSKDYLPHFGSKSADEARLLLLKIDPADVVSIPTDYSFTKGRAWKYTILADVTDTLGVVAQNSANVMNRPVIDEDFFDDNFSEDDDDYFDHDGHFDEL